MKKRKVLFINEDIITSSLAGGYVVFVRPMGSKVFRAFVPDVVRHNEEVMQIINLWSTRCINGIHYIRTTTDEALTTLGETLFLTNFDNFIIVEPAENVWYPNSVAMLN